jgi:hypothetical protein
MKKTIYFALSLIGFLASSYLIFKFYTVNEMSTSAALTQITSNTMGILFVVDFLISVVAAWIFIYNESNRLGMKYWWVYILLTCGVGFCFAFPLFLYFREKQLEA